MNGRLEHSIRTRENIKLLLNELPKYVSDFYYEIQIDLEPLTCLEYIRKIKGFLDYANCDIEKINGRIIGEYFEKIQTKIDKNGNVLRTSTSYRGSVWTILKRFFDFLYEEELIHTHPMKKTKRPRNKDEIKHEFLKMEDLNAILQAVEEGVGSSKAKKTQEKWKERDMLIMYLFMATGMRKTALSEINVSDIHFEDNEIFVIDKRSKNLHYNITEEMKIYIKSWLKKREQLLYDKEEEALFISSRCRRMNEKSIYKLVRKYSEEALGEAIHPHDFRSAFISLTYEEFDGDIEAVKEAVGHESITTTSRYISLRNDARKSAQSFMAKSLYSSITN